jgi:hypothetical protein
MRLGVSIAFGGRVGIALIGCALVGSAPCGCVRRTPEKTAPSATLTTTTEPAPPPPPTATFAPNDPLAPYPGAMELCNRLQFQQNKPLHWRSWTTTDDYAKVTAYYRAKAKALKVDEPKDKDALEIREGAERVLMIYPADKASAHPQCNKPIDASNKTVIMLSELRMP